MKNIALLGRITSLERFRLLANLLDEHNRGVRATPVEYTDDAAKDIEKRLCENFDGVVCWVDPVSSNSIGKEETRADWAGNDGGLDKMLRRVASKGVHVSTHPDIIEKMGTKRVLFDTRNEPWGLPNTHYYKTKEDLRENFRHSLLSDKCRVIKMERGSSGRGVWRCDVVEDDEEHTSIPATNDKQLLLRVQHAGDDTIETNVTLDAMLSRLEERMEKTGGGVVDMPFLPRVNEGIIRCYILRDRCRGILHQLPLTVSDVESASYPNLNVSKSKKYQTKGLAEGKCVHPPDSPEYQDLVTTLENDWIPKLVQAVGLLPSENMSIRDALPVVWDIDFIQTSTKSMGCLEQGTHHLNKSNPCEYVLCEVNCSCVFPAELMKEIGNEIVDWVKEW